MTWLRHRDSFRPIARGTQVRVRHRSTTRPFWILVLCVAIGNFVGEPDQASAQEVAGHVVLEGWGERVPGATVLLLDSTLTPLDSVRTDGAGEYSLSLPTAGSFSLQARLGRLSGPTTDLPSVDVGRVAEGVILELPSPLYRRAFDCYAYGADPGTGVLAGLVYGAGALPVTGDAEIVLEWEASGGAQRTRRIEVGEGGRFVACDLPSGRPISVHVELEGRRGTPHPGIVIDEWAVARHDLRAPAGLRVVEVADPGARRLPDVAEQGPSAVRGRLVDATSGRPIGQATVVFPDLGRTGMTDADGRFRFEEVPPGTHLLSVRHLAYGEHAQPLEVEPASELQVEVHVAARAIELDEITVEARRRTVGARVAGARDSRTLTGERLTRMEERGTPLYQALSEVQGLRLEYFRRCPECITEVCVESSQGRFGPGGCEMVEVFVDGVSLPSAPDVVGPLLRGGLHDYERIEYLGPVEAAQWGFRANQAGALFLWTRVGGGPRE